MIDQHLGRRSVSDFQRGVLALRKREILEERRATASDTPADQQAAAQGHIEPKPVAASPNPLKSRSDIAKAARLSSSQVVQIEKIQRQAAPELVAALKAGTISINAAAAVASLPTEEQKTAALGGKDELKQAAKRVRDVQRKTPEKDSANEQDSSLSSLLSLQQRVDALTAENQQLRQQLSTLQAQLNSVQ